MIAIRGAICAENNAQDVMSQAARLIEGIMHNNVLDRKDIVSIVFSVTKDLDVANPSTGIREILQWCDVALFTTQEQYVVGSLPRCIRALVLVDSSISKSDIVHTYLDGAQILRPDLCN